MRSLVHTFVDLGDAVSRNLEFAHANHSRISYGEETITETNLLDVLRRHKDIGTKLTAISKRDESAIGADWEWIISGRSYSFFMRVQAKRTKRNNSLTVNHIIGKGTKEERAQIDVLIERSKPEESSGTVWRPVYCFYSKNSERVLWKSPEDSAGFEDMQYGCLIADAVKVKSKEQVRGITDVEDISVPWHFFFSRDKGRRVRRITRGIEAIDVSYFDDSGRVYELSYVQSVFEGGVEIQDGEGEGYPEDYKKRPDMRRDLSFPDVHDLNEGTELEDIIGVERTDWGKIENMISRSLDDVSRPPLLVIDVRRY